MNELAENTDVIAENKVAKEGKYLTFTLADEEYGIGIRKIKEIIGIIPITSVPQTPRFVRGVVNLRGKVIPVIDLRLRFDMDSIDYTERTVIVVVEIEGSSGMIQLGVVVDSVSEVINIYAKDIEDTPSFGMTVNTEYIMGMAKVDGKVKILLNIDNALSLEELSDLEAMDE